MAETYAQMEKERNRLRIALRELLEQIDCLDDISFSRDTEPYKAEACWNDAYERARRALREGRSCERQI